MSQKLLIKRYNFESNQSSDFNLLKLLFASPINSLNSTSAVILWSDFTQEQFGTVFVFVSFVLNEHALLFLSVFKANASVIQMFEFSVFEETNIMLLPA